MGRRLRNFGWPWSRLSREGRGLSAILCAAAVFGADVGGSQAHVLLLASLALLLGALTFTRAYRLDSVRATLSVPRRVSVGDELSISIELSNTGSRGHHHIRIEPPLLGWDGRFTAAAAEIIELPPGGRHRSLAKARFSERGEHQIEAFRVMALLPLGLSQGPALRTAVSRIVVVPRVARIVSLSTPEQRRHQPGGVSRASRTGDATDLLGVRPYRAGDPLRDLHARASARHNQPMVREYQEEYFARIGVVVDTALNGASAAQLEGALSLTAGIVARLCGGEALVDVLLAGRQVQSLSLGRSLGSLEQVLDVLAVTRAEAEFAADRVLAQLAPHVARLSCVVFVALAWDEARAAFVTALEARGLRAVVFVVGEPAARFARYTTVSLGAITQGREIAL